MADGPFDSSVAFIVQARMASSRLPGKVLMPMPFGNNETILSQICNTLQTFDAKLIIATSVNTENDAIESYCLENGISCYRGKEENVLSRFCEIQKMYKFKHIFRFTADNPLIDSEKLQKFFKKYLFKDLDYANSKGMPLGMNFEVFKGQILESLPQNEMSDKEKEHVTPYIKANEQYNKATLELSNHDNYRMTVDTPIDYAQLSLVFHLKEQLGVEGLKLVDIVIKKYPWLLNLNSGVLQLNSHSNPSEEVEEIAALAEKMGYHAAARKLQE